jgi:hypothetical protein
MPSIARHLPDLRSGGPVLPVRIGLGADAEAALRGRGEPIPVPIEALALIDTAAGRSVVKAELMHRLGVSPVGAVQIDTASTRDMDVYEYYVRLWFAPQESVEVRVLEAPLPTDTVEILIGRDVLASGTFVYEGRANRFRLDLRG